MRMLQYAVDMWESFFVPDIAYPLQVVGSSNVLVENADDLYDHLTQSFFLFTYRCSFESIPTLTYDIRSDQGWGCLLRTSQMLLGHFLRRYVHEEDCRLQHFFDMSGDAFPFSIHNMVRSVWDKKAFRPEYWSPSQGCEALSRVVRAAVKSKRLRTNVEVVVSCSGCLFEEDITRALSAGCEAVLILIPLRVSPDSRLNQETFIQLGRLLQQPACLGMVGGVPGRSYYFFGYSQTQLLYLDPHLRNQPALTHDGVGKTGVVQPGLEDVHALHWSRVDTSLFLGFAVRSQDEWEVLRERLPTKFLHLEAKRSWSEYQLANEQRKQRNVEYTSVLRANSKKYVRDNGEGAFRPVSSNQIHASTSRGYDRRDRSSSSSWEMFTEP